MAAVAKVSVVDKGYTARLRAIASMDGRVTSRVGVYGEEAAKQHERSDLTNGELAAIHEFGVGVPERSFVRAWIDESEKQIVAQLKAEATDVLTGKRDVYTASSRVGRWAEDEIRARIARGISPPNAPTTVARKGSSTPLVDSGELVGAISSAAERDRKVLK